MRLETLHHYYNQNITKRLGNLDPYWILVFFLLLDLGFESFCNVLIVIMMKSFQPHQVIFYLMLTGMLGSHILLVNKKSDYNPLIIKLIFPPAAGTYRLHQWSLSPSIGEESNWPNGTNILVGATISEGCVNVAFGFAQLSRIILLIWVGLSADSFRPSVRPLPLSFFWLWVWKPRYRVVHQNRDKKSSWFGVGGCSIKRWKYALINLVS